MREVTRHYTTMLLYTYYTYTSTRRHVRGEIFVLKESDGMHVMPFHGHPPIRLFRPSIRPSGLLHTVRAQEIDEFVIQVIPSAD